MGRRRRRDDGQPAQVTADRLSLDDLLEAGVAATGAVPTARVRLDEVVTELAERDGLGLGDGSTAGETALSSLLTAALHGRWTAGWEPLDVVHVARRGGGHRVARLAAAVITADPVGGPAAPHVPPAWARQLEALEASASTDEPAVYRWRCAEALPLPDAFEDGLRLVAILRGAPPLQPIDGPPSDWTAASVPGRGAATTVVDERVLRTIRALLAKAESTTYPAEAETFTAKAQELMARHAVDAAVLAARAPAARRADVTVRRVHVDEPYGAEKATLLHVVADTNDVSVVWDDEVGMATCVGFAADVELTVLLFTSLLVQATGALAEAGRAGGDRQPPAFRRAFLVAYAEGVADRLAAARDRARHEAAGEVGADLVPLLTARRTAVEEVAHDLFPHTVPGRARSFDGLGWDAGRHAAERADLFRQNARP